MTRRHFEALAGALRSSKPAGNGTLYHQWVKDVNTISRVCEDYNPRFNKKKFDEACGYERT